MTAPWNDRLSPGDTAAPALSLRQQALDALLQPEPAVKADAARALQAQALAYPSWAVEGGGEGCLPLSASQRAALPGRPLKPSLVPAKDVPTRSPFTLEGRAALLHAICHIEFNAINLALDAVWRFDDMPADFYTDWLKVAAEEALHFTLLREHLQGLGHDYGDFDAHNGLWAMCERTAHDILARMALVPRTLEARGLDATPPIQAKLRKAGDEAAVGILNIILRDEVGHVAIGNRWFHHLCRQRGLDPVLVYPELVTRYEAPRLKPPYNMEARLKAGFTDAEMRFLLGEDH
ncbi:MAG: ferritin-like domain-containing protein [Aquabacterium sp.]|uniref:ferritin-like domain-containing protein n=1 Tax=Aquabacterium sp. TaxID=1872578 RepID=UPI003BAE5247